MIVFFTNTFVNLLYDNILKIIPHLCFQIITHENSRPKPHTSFRIYDTQQPPKKPELYTIQLPQPKKPNTTR